MRQNTQNGTYITKRILRLTKEHMYIILYNVAARKIYDNKFKVVPGYVIKAGCMREWSYRSTCC
jgi:hypothetical protein